MATNKDIEDRLSKVIGDSGTIGLSMGGYEIIFTSTKDVRWQEIFDILLEFGFFINIMKKDGKMALVAYQQL